MAQDYSTRDACSLQVLGANKSGNECLWTNDALLSLQQFTSNLPLYFLESLAESSSCYVSGTSDCHFSQKWWSVEANDNWKNSLQAISKEDQKQGMETDSCPHITSRLFLHCQI